MSETIISKMLDYGVLGIVCLVLGYAVYRFWQNDRAEKKRLIERLEKLNDELREKK
jgi:uncharacterized membrane-anchored protein YhcB (DUF1043 family)